MNPRDEISDFLKYYVPDGAYTVQEDHGVIFIDLKHTQTRVKIYPDWWKFRRKAVENQLIVKTGNSDLLHGRETMVKRVDADEARDFFEATHLAGYLKAKIKLGLFHYSELVMCATFANPRKWDRNGKPFVSAEMVGLCSAYGINVRGGAEKLLSHYIEQFSPDEVITFSDNSFSEGDVFRNIGFRKAGEKPPMGYIVDEWGRRKFTNEPTELINEGYTKWVLDVNTLEK